MKQLPPIYTLAYGIHVIGEYPARGKNRYVRLRIRPHSFFPDAPIVANGIMVRKNRVILSIKLGRMLETNEHAHHRDENELNDDPDNIELRTAADHNRHHKTGTRKTAESKAKTSASMKKAFAEGRHAPTIMREQNGERNCSAKLTREKVIEIRASNASREVLAVQYGVSIRNIGMIKQGITWK